MDPTTLETAITELLAAGAVLDVTDTKTSSWPLARHHRLDGDVVWIRPLIGGRREPAGRVVFPLGDCIRRGLSTEWAVAAGEELQFARGDAVGGQEIRIRPATNLEELTTLELWDTFVLVVLTAAEEAELDALETDSWHGRFT